MSLEALCHMKNDYDVLARLGKLPRKLAALYKDIYDDFFVHTYEVGQPLIRNTFKWLLCIKGSLSSYEFLAAIVQNLSPAPATLTREELLDLCSNFVAYDAGLDKFNFAHPSVREFLEDLPDYSKISSNATAAECCLVYMIGRAESSTARRFLSERFSISETNDRSIRNSFYSHGFGVYAARYGLVHCTAAKTARACESLRPALEVFLMDDSGRQSPLSWWTKRSPYYALPEASRSWWLRNFSTDQSKYSHRGFIYACTFGYPEIVAQYSQSSLPDHTREQALMMSTLADQRDIESQLLEPETKFISSRHVLKSLLNHHDKAYCQENIDFHSEKIVQSILSHCHSDAIDEDDVIHISHGFPSIAPGFLRQYAQSRIGKDMLLRTIELRFHDPAFQVLLSSLEITQDILKSALRNSKLTKRILILLESREGQVEKTLGLLESVSMCKSQEVLEEIILRQGALITPTVIKWLMRKDQDTLINTLVTRNPNIRITPDLMEFF